MDGIYCIYIMTNKINTVLYTGQTSSLLGRTQQHKQGMADGFTKRYKTTKLVYYEVAEDLDSALYRENPIKGYTRKKKIALIESINPIWEDLTDKIIE
jgi:putative endonuclease